MRSFEAAMELQRAEDNCKSCQQYKRAVGGLNAQMDKLRAESESNHRLFYAAVEALGEISMVLGIDDEIAEAANGNVEILAAIRALQKKAAAP